jgi:hypothetical protein
MRQTHGSREYDLAGGESLGLRQESWRRRCDPSENAENPEWAGYLDLVLAGEIREVGQRESIVVAIDRAAALAAETGAQGR